MPLITNNQPSEITNPGKSSFHFPSSFVSAKSSSVLRFPLTPIGTMRRDEFYFPAFQALSQLIVNTPPYRKSAALLTLRMAGTFPRNNCLVQGRLISVSFAGAAESKWFPRGIPLPSATTIHFVPFPRLVFPTQSPLFGLVRSSHRQKSRPSLFGRVHQVQR